MIRFNKIVFKFLSGILLFIKLILLIQNYPNHTAATFCVNILLEDTWCNRYEEQCLCNVFQRCAHKNPNYREFDDNKPIQVKKMAS